MPNPNGKIQVIICKCGATFAGCTEPECYTDSGWLKDLGLYLKKGCSIEMRKELTFQKCTCEKKKKKKPIDLFTE